jgi:hypothetical protein
MKSDEIIGQMVRVQEKDGNEWLGMITTKDVKAKASNPFKYNGGGQPWKRAQS